MAYGDPICNPFSFRDAARWQQVCAVCRKPTKGRFQAHHVVDMRTLQDRCHLSGNALYDTRNALRLCQGLGDVNVRCHFQHENYMRLVKTKELMDENIVYAFAVLGEYALDYLRNEYDDSDPDPRIEHALKFLRQRT